MQGAAGEPDRYRWIFDNSAVSLWEQDISAVRPRIRELKQSGVTALDEHLRAHPLFVEEVIRSIRVVDVNYATLDLFEAGDKGQLLGPLDLTLDPVNALPAFRELILAIDEGRGTTETASTARTLGGRRLDVLIRRTIPPADSPRQLMLVSVIDVTERRYMERKLEEEMGLLRSLLNSNPDQLLIKDREGRIVMANASFAAVMGVADPAEVVGKTDEDLYPPEVAAQHRRDNELVMESRQALLNREEEERGPAGEERGPAGEARWLLVSRLPVMGGDGGVIGIICIGRDITERRRMEERNAQLATLVESVNDAIMGTDADGVVTSWNRGAERLYGYPADQVIGRPLAQLLPAELLATMREIRESVHAGRSVENLEASLKLRGGRSLSVALSSTPVRDARGRIIGAATISRDVTAQKALQAQVIRAQRLESLATLAGGIAHQFNNINAVVKGYLEILLSDDGLTEGARTYAREMMESVRKAVEITDRLQGLTRSSPSSAARVRLGDQVRSFLPVLAREAESQGASLGADLAENPLVTASATLLHFVVTSMLTNALHAVLDRPVREVSMRTGRQGRFGVLEVSDTGCGIPADDLPRIFTPFFTTKGEWAASGSAQARVKGVGLSLAVCQSTVAEHGGWIEVESEPGAGSRFRVYLPAEDAPA
jgi:PAS domain S-box-containing protein